MPTSYRVKTQGSAYAITKAAYCLVQNLQNGTINYSRLTNNEHIDEIKRLPLYEQHNMDMPYLLRGHYALPDIQFLVKYLPECKDWILDNYREPPRQPPPRTDVPPDPPAWVPPPPPPITPPPPPMPDFTRRVNDSALRIRVNFFDFADF